MTEQPICARCVLPEAPPRIRFDAEGICNLCREHSAQERQAPLLESDFVRILDKHRGRHRYDCLVMCSGGKDSTAALYYMVKRYKVRPLAFMFDHGFETEEATENVQRAVDRLGVDFVLFRTDAMKDMFRKMLKSGSKAVLCHPCSIWYMGLGFEMAGKFDCPIIIAGWTKGQSVRQDVMSACGCNVNQLEYAAMARETERFLDEELGELPQYRDFPRTMEEMLKRSRKVSKAMVLSPHWFLSSTPEDYVRIIRSELGWKYPGTSYPLKSTNCYLNFISVRNSMRDYGYTHYHVEMSKLIREGVLSREEALSSLKIDFSDELLNGVLSRLGLNLKDIP